MARKAIVTAIVIASTLSLTACGHGFDAATRAQQPSGNGRNLTTDQLVIRNANLVVDPLKPGSAVLVATFVNTSDQDNQLVSITSDAAITATEDVTTPIPAGEVVRVSYNAEKVIALQSDAFVAGKFVKISLVFANGEVADLSLLVSTNTEAYADVVVPELTSTTPVVN